MTRGIIVIAIFLSALVLSLQQEVASNSDYDYEDDYYDNDDPETSNDSEETENTTTVPVKRLTAVQTVKIDKPKVTKVKRDREELTTQRQPANYEVTELVIDIPDVNTRRVPILTNFTVTRPLNFAGKPNNNTDNVGVKAKDEGDEVINSIFVPDEPKASTNNQDKNVKDRNDIFNENKNDHDYFSHFSPPDNFDHEFEKEFGSDEEDYFKFKEEPTKPKKSFKDYFHNFRNSFVNKFKSVTERHVDDIHDSLRKIVDGPFSFFNKLHKKTSDLASKIHKAVSRHKTPDKDDDFGYHDTDQDCNH